MEIKKPYGLVQYNKFMKGIDRSDQTSVITQF
jgi:hypothetical protein